MMDIEKFTNQLSDKDYKYIFSSPQNKDNAKKVIVRKVDDNKIYWQIEKHLNNQVFHTNIDANELSNCLIDNFNLYNQCCIHSDENIINVFKFGEKVVVKKENQLNKMVPLTHNKQKHYIINEGDEIPALLDLGVFTKENKIVSSKYDKFKQINKFIEIIDEKMSKYESNNINIIDFGCGKSYLTFILYYYLTKIKNINVNIKGYDLKADVVNRCNDLAKKYNYKNLHFYNQDIATVVESEKIDMLITLHACATATDYALNFAINNNVQYIFSVPCCQHEINLSIHKGGEFDLMLDFGIIKERFSALLTDTIRAKVLQSRGYKVDILEFVDFNHTPKNLMIRAEKTNNHISSLDDLDNLSKQYRFKQKLLDLQNLIK